MAMTKEKWDAIIDAIYAGLTTSKAVENQGVTRKQFYEYKNADSLRESEYARAQQDRSDLDVDELITIADDPTIDSNRARNMIDVRKWTASKRMPSKYGDRIDLNVQSTVDIGPALQAARARLLSICDQPKDVEADVIETIEHASPKVTGSKPVTDESASKSSDELDPLGLFE